jgi:hypothetical protein
MEWHTIFSSRSKSVRHVIEHAAGATAFLVDQSTKGGAWNRLAELRFDGPGSVTIRAEDRLLSTNADAVRFRCRARELPEVVIDSISPRPALESKPVRLEGHDVGGSTVDRFEWTSDLGGFLGDEPVISVRLQPGLHQISLRARDIYGAWGEPATEALIVESDPCAGLETIIDNRSAWVSSIGSWLPSTAPGAFGQDSVWSKRSGTRSDRVAFTFDSTVRNSAGEPVYQLLFPGIYEVFEWHTVWPTRTRTAPHEIRHRYGVTTVNVDQSVLGSRWNSLGIFEVSDSGLAVSILCVDSERSTNADAVKFVCRFSFE